MWRTWTEDVDFFPELRYKLLEFNSRKICQHLTNWTRWNKRDKFCLSSLVINIQRTLSYGNLSITDGLFNSKDAKLIIPPFVLRIMALSYWCRAPFVIVFRVFFAKLSKCERSHPGQVFFWLGLTFSWTVSCSIKAFWGQMLEDAWALGHFLWACIPSWHNKGSFLTESNSQHWYSADNSGIGWRKGPRIHGRTLDFTSFGMFFWTFVYIFSPRFVVVVIYRCLRALRKSQNWPARVVILKMEYYYFLGIYAKTHHYRTYYRAFSLTWPASMLIYWNKRKRVHKKRV